MWYGTEKQASQLESLMLLNVYTHFKTHEQSLNASFMVQSGLQAVNNKTPMPQSASVYSDAFLIEPNLEQIQDGFSAVC